MDNSPLHPYSGTDIQMEYSSGRDFVLALPQANIEYPLYMELTKGVELQQGNKSKPHVLQLVKKLYRQK